MGSVLTANCKGDKMNVMKIVLAVVDFDDLGPCGVRRTIEEAKYPNRCISPSVLSVDVRDIGEWEDSNPLNFKSSQHAEMDRLFCANEDSATTGSRSDPQVADRRTGPPDRRLLAWPGYVILPPGVAYTRRRMVAGRRSTDKR
jgi:hypothetical protein